MATRTGVLSGGVTGTVTVTVSRRRG